MKLLNQKEMVNGLHEIETTLEPCEFIMRKQFDGHFQNRPHGEQIKPLEFIHTDKLEKHVNLSQPADIGIPFMFVDDYS